MDISKGEGEGKRFLRDAHPKKPAPPPGGNDVERIYTERGGLRKKDPL